MPDFVKAYEGLAEVSSLRGDLQGDAGLSNFQHNLLQQGILLRHVCLLLGFWATPILRPVAV